MTQPRLGVDIGRVIIAGPEHRHGAGAGAGAGAREDTAFFDGSEQEMLATPAVDGVFEVLARLTGRFEGRVWLVSKCSPQTGERSLRWLGHHGFWERTGVPRDAFRFCRQRHEKAPIAAELGLTHFVDDRVDVHRALRGVVPHRYLFGGHEEPAPDDPEVLVTPLWEDVERAVLGSLGGRAADGPPPQV